MGPSFSDWFLKGINKKLKVANFKFPKYGKEPFFLVFGVRLVREGRG